MNNYIDTDKLNLNNSDIVRKIIKVGSYRPKPYKMFTEKQIKRYKIDESIEPDDIWWGFKNFGVHYPFRIALIDYELGIEEKVYEKSIPILVLNLYARYIFKYQYKILTHIFWEISDCSGIE